MKTTKIADADIAKMKISSLPSRPTAPAAFGGAGYTAAQVKAAFDKLPLFIIGKLNDLIDDIYSDGEDSLAGAIPTGISAGHTLAALFKDIKSGEASEYFMLGEETLGEYKTRVSEELRLLLSRLEEAYLMILDPTLDGGTPSERAMEFEAANAEWYESDSNITEGEDATVGGDGQE